MATAPLAANTIRRVTFRGGWLGLFTGESQGKALERVIPQLNFDGYRVVFIVPDHWSFIKRVLSFILLICTVGFVGLSPNLLVIGEHMASVAAAGRATP